MTDDLRTRIAAAAANAHYAWDNADRDDRRYWLTVAAVIRELGLRIEYGAPSTPTTAVGVPTTTN